MLGCFGLCQGGVLEEVVFKYLIWANMKVKLVRITQARTIPIPESGQQTFESNSVSDISQVTFKDYSGENPRLLGVLKHSKTAKEGEH